MPKIKNAKILILATDGFDQTELASIREKLKSAGALVHVAGPKVRKSKDKKLVGWHDGQWGEEIAFDTDAADASPSFYDALVMPGGLLGADALRVNEDALKLAEAFTEEEQTLAACGHGVSLLIEANVVRGREITACAAIKTDVENAGAKWIDEDAASDVGIVTGKGGGDLTRFIAKVIEAVEIGTHERAELSE